MYPCIILVCGQILKAGREMVKDERKYAIYVPERGKRICKKIHQALEKEVSYLLQ